MSAPYSASRVRTVRRPTIEVKVGSVGIGGANPVRIQSMTTSDTQDIDATVRQSIALAEVGCEIVRVTAPNVQAAQCLREIRRRLSDAGFGAIPLVADIHFLPQAAMEAVEHVEKVRVNPGNYADKKKFAVKEYSDSEYDSELQRLHDSFSPLVIRCRELGRAMRIGTNHGSLSDRIMNRYGDSPLGMVESALEFLRIAEAHNFRSIVLSMKASNPKVMIQAYRLLVQRMALEGMHYPLHLGVTEAGDGEDGRIKSAIGIGSLLCDGLGDTIRVSLTEDSVYEIPVARALADKAMAQWTAPASATPEPQEALDCYSFRRRSVADTALAPSARLGSEQPPRVIVRVPAASAAADAATLRSRQFLDTPAEGVLVAVDSAPAARAVLSSLASVPETAAVLEVPALCDSSDWAEALAQAVNPLVLAPVRSVADTDLRASFESWSRVLPARNSLLALNAAASEIAALAPRFAAFGAAHLLFSAARGHGHALGDYRSLTAALDAAGLGSCIWIRNTDASALRAEPSFLSRLLESSVLTGSLLCDGIGDLVSIETETDAPRATRLAYNVLQGAGARISKTEFVACPSCGRTLFDLQTTTQRIRAQTGHLKGVKIAIMGCIVNGPGEMADADFGYVGGAPGKINLYVGKSCVQYNIPQHEADARLIALIREHGKWFDPKPEHASDGKADTASTVSLM
ncbi:(E)-4-hydroxy-3-methylbut-2-enyl-diphosphate synthase [Nibricoccus sp. IMCC34717]|uniref:(E)-4-hydroxy-3-methylbut-2-enyl-diphosphate synthase n=1 Tax=Nibricoccus sp. IMCC34717 TaxID=3034021 RepID=UPI00384FF1F9